MEPLSDSHPKQTFLLSNFLIRKQFFWLKYLPLPIPWYNRIVLTFGSLVHLSFLIRIYIYNFVPLDPLLALSIGDFAYDLVPIHNIIWFVHAFWWAGSVFTFHLLNKTNNSVKMQTWFTCLSILEDGKDDFFDKPNDKLVHVSKLYFFNAKSTLLAGPTFSFCMFIPHMINHYSNVPLLIVIVIHALITTVAAFTTVVLCVTMCYLFGFYAFLVGQKLHQIAETFKTQIDQVIKSNRKILANSSRFLGLLKEAHYASYFWSKLNSCAFINTFFPQILILYSVCFVPLNKIHFICLVGLGTLNFACGLSVNFLGGAYARLKLNHCQKQLLRVIILKGDKLKLNHKLKLLTTSEYLLNRKLFAMFASLEMNSFNYLMVFIEMAAHLMLVIVNANRKCC
ncbi:uncharacterized protein LOC112539563 [Tetranychus urticae]|uniref:Odorant receptor n=1 Tax=Tetranychus urticae TaxID=32264 RepID=T1L058_TETUR|nr:uncharacterized protein LOC112539563 [Tetranychus urticae]